MSHFFEKFLSSNPSNSCARLLALCSKAGGNSNDLDRESERFLKVSTNLEQQLEFFRKEVEDITIISLVALWAKFMSADSLNGERNIQAMLHLIEHNVISLSNSEQLLKLFDYPEHGKVIWRLRYHSDLTIDRREELVAFYLDFTNWLSKVTYGYIKLAEDEDRKAVIGKKFPFEKYISLVSLLELRERLLVKLFYFGDALSQEDVFSLKIKDIDFEKKCIAFQSHKIAYPLHVFHELKEFITDKKNGFVFTNRAGEKIDHTVPYRNLKRVALQLNFNPNFAFGDLTK